MTEVDILAIDAKIKHNFRLEEKKLHLYKDNLSYLSTLIKNDDISQRTRTTLSTTIEDLKTKINDIENKTKENFYISETVSLLEKYKKILNTPMRMSFMGKPTIDNTEKNTIIEDYLIIANKYVELDYKSPQKVTKVICNNCKNCTDFDTMDNVHICIYCGSQQEVFSYTSSYNDVDRANISVKYTYDRKVHFRDCMNQYQGIQNCTIDQKVYDDLIEQFKLHHLLDGDENTQKEIRFARVEKEHIHIFLKELNYTKHYENINLIHYNLTGKKPDNISHLENKLLDDFDRLTELYDKVYKQDKKIERKSFINTQYVLYQLLRRHKHPCKPEDFHILKTIDRQYFHDGIASHLFSLLGWNFTPSF